MRIQLPVDTEFEFPDELDQEEVLRLGRPLIETIVETSPSESLLTVRVFRALQGLGVEFLINHSRGCFYSIGKGQDLESAFLDAFNKMQIQILEWDENRYKSGPLHHANVMVVDDEPESVQLITNFLKTLDCNIQVINSPKRALKLVEPGFTDLIILDWRMPEMDGNETLKALENHIAVSYDPDWVPKLKIPLLIYSALQREAIRIPTLKRLQLVGFLQKGGGFTELKDYMRKLVKQVESRRKPYLAPQSEIPLGAS